jgi:MFS family permease
MASGSQTGVKVAQEPKIASVGQIVSNFGTAFKDHGTTLAGLFTAWTFDAMDATVYAYAVPSIMKDLKVSMGEAFSVVSVFLICTAVGGLLLGNLGDKIGRKPTVLLSIALYGLFTFMCGRAATIGELRLYRGLVGFGLGGLWPAAMALISELWPAKSRGAAVGTLQTGWTIGLLLAALFAYALIPLYGWRGMFYATLIPVAIAFFTALIFVKESPIWLERRKQEKAASKSNAIPLVLLFNHENIRNTFLGLGVSVFGMYGWWTLFTFLPTYIDKTLNVGITKGAMFMAWTSLGAFVGYLLFGVLADRYGRRPMFTAFFAGMAVMISVFIYSVRTSGLAYFPIVGIVLGFFTGYYSGYGALFSELYSTNMRATGAGLLINFGRAAVFVGPMIVTYLIPRVGFSLAMNSAALAFVVAAVFILLMKETRGIEITSLDK